MRLKASGLIKYSLWGDKLYATRHQTKPKRQASIWDTIPSCGKMQFLIRAYLASVRLVSGVLVDLLLKT